MSHSYAICKYFQLLLKSHYQILYLYLDPLNLQELLFTSLKLKCSFIFPNLTILVTLFIGDVYFVYSSKNNFSLTLDLVMSNPRLMTHQAFPREMWSQMDVIYTIAVASSFVTYIILITNPYTVDRYLAKVKGQHHQNQLLMIKGQSLHENVSKTITSFHKRLHRPAFTLFIFVIIFLNLFCYLFVFFVNAVYELSFVELTFWLLLYPLSIFYMVYTLCTITLFIIITCKFIQFRQRSLLERLNKLTKKVVIKEEYSSRSAHKRRNQKRSISNIYIYYPWLLYEQFNADLLHLCAHVEQTSIFWSPLLTVYFCSQIVFLCYVVYICFFIPGLPVIVKYITRSFLPVLVLLLFGTINTCARLVDLNDRLEQANARFCSQITKLFLIKNNNRMLLKVSLVLHFILKIFF